MAASKTPQQTIVDSFAHAPIGTHQSLSVSTVQTLTIPTDARSVIVQAITQNIRLKLSGTATASQGFQIATGHDPQAITLASTSVISVCAETGTAVLEHQFMGV